MFVPFLNLNRLNGKYRTDFNQAFREILENGWFIQGSHLEMFEAEFSKFCDVDHCVGVGNGLDALKLLLLAYEIGPGDEVIVPSNTFIATWLAVTQCGAIPIPVDPCPDTFNMDVTNIRSVISPRTKAIIPVHLYGFPADMDVINQIAHEFSLIVIEDAAQAQGAWYKGRPTCSLGHAAATSFYPGKNLGALGDGGAILTNDEEIALKVKNLRNYGSTSKYIHNNIGFNSRLDELQAAFLRIKLRDLEFSNLRRSEIADRYLSGIKNRHIVRPTIPEWGKHAWHLFVIKCTRRDRLQSYLTNNSIQTLIHYPVPPHLQECYPEYNHMVFPIAEDLSNVCLSLPISPDMTDDEIDFVINKLNDFC